MGVVGGWQLLISPPDNQQRWVGDSMKKRAHPPMWFNGGAGDTGNRKSSAYPNGGGDQTAAPATFQLYQPFFFLHSEFTTPVNVHRGGLMGSIMLRLIMAGCLR